MKLVVSIVVGLLPGYRMRAALYRTLLGYRIAAGARIGFGTVLCVDAADIGAARVGPLNHIRGPFQFTVGDGAALSSGNQIRCGDWSTPDAGAGPSYARYCRIGRHAVVTQNHYIDATGGFALGDDAVLGGRGTQVWTHGNGVERREVSIGAGTYVGSRCLFTPGSRVADECVVGAGSVVSQEFDEPLSLIAGNPATVRKTGLSPRRGRIGSGKRREPRGD